MSNTVEPPNTCQYVVSAEYVGWRLDRYLHSQLENYSRKDCQQMILQKQVLANERVVEKITHRLSLEEQLEVHLPIPTNSDDVNDDLPVTQVAAPVPLPELSIIYADEHLLVIDKPAGLVVHEGAGVQGVVLSQILEQRYPQLQKLARAGIVHRLDKGTTGVMLIAHSEKARLNLVEKFKSREIEKIYNALVHGETEPTGKIDRPIARNRKSRIKMAIDDRADKPALTYYRTLWRTGGFSWLEIKLVTGRTHQIRVHMEAIGHPLLGDSLYSKHARPGNQHLNRPALHACKISLNHPITDEPVSFSSPLPEDLQSFLDKLRADNKA